MKSPLLNTFVCAPALVLLAATGCNRHSPPPAALPAAELPAALGKAFAKSPAEVKALASETVSAVQSQDYPKAFRTLQTLSARPGLTKEQLNVTSRAMLTVTELLQAAQTKGDAKAAQALKTYRLDK